MSEMSQALHLLASLPANVLTKNPAGSYSFVGSVDVQLRYVIADGPAKGGVPTDDQIRIARQCGPKIAGLSTRVWPTPEAAIADATALGLRVQWDGDAR